MISTSIDINSLKSLITKSNNDNNINNNNNNNINIKSIEDQFSQTKLLNIQPKLNTHLIKKSTDSSAHINLLNSLLNSNNSRLVRSSGQPSSSSSVISSLPAQNETSNTDTSLVATSSVDTTKLFEALQSIKILSVKQADTDLKIQYYNRFLLI
jgi:hypothetical protein